MKNRHLLLVITAIVTTATFSHANAVEIANDYGKKIVYTSNSAADTTPLKEDCQRRNGTFRECGSICEDKPEPQPCATVCAYTCENIPVK